MNEEEFSALVAEAFESLPEEFKAQLKNVAIVIEDEPTSEQRTKLHLSPYGSLYGLYEGVPTIIPGKGRAQYPDKITIFRLPIIATSYTLDDVRNQIRKTLEHEVGHYFGMNDAQLRKLKR